MAKLNCLIGHECFAPAVAKDHSEVVLQLVTCWGEPLGEETLPLNQKELADFVLIQEAEKNEVYKRDKVYECQTWRVRCVCPDCA